MSLLDSLTDQIISRNNGLHTLRPIIEKEILHQDILREMAQAGFLKNLTFIGGTCLRNCYNSPRLSEDIDFTGGIDFQKDELSELGRTLKENISERYGMRVEVSEPQRETGDTATWKIKVVTRPDRPDLPTQRIHIDICAVSSFERKPVMLMDHYQVDMGTSGLILYAESREEILSDKYLALAQRPNRVKQRDIWDIVWLTRQSVQVKPELLIRKLDERNISHEEYLHDLAERIDMIKGGHKAFLFEIRRFLPMEVVRTTLEQPEYWDFTLSVIQETYTLLSRTL